MFTTSTRSLARWIVALPLLMVGTLLFWSLALSLGGLSLMRAMTLASPPDDLESFEAAPPEMVDGPSPSGTIMVRLQESALPEDLTDVPPSRVRDNAGAGGFVSPDDQAASVPGPGPTSY